jgi:hypothetical protein
MRPKTFAQLTNAAHSSHIVVINGHKKRCDAIILLRGSDEIKHVALPELSVDNARKWCNALQGSTEDTRGDNRGTQVSPPDRPLGSLWVQVAWPILATLEIPLVSLYAGSLYIFEGLSWT